MPVQRNWTVPEDEHRKPLIEWTAEGDLIVNMHVVPDGDNDALHEAVFEILAILRRVGGTVQIASQRAEVAPNIVITESFIFGYDSFTPLVRRLEGYGDDAELTDEEQAAHFPPLDGTAVGDAIAAAQDEEPATPEPVAAVE